jgi:small subunit ribosomal protein S13
MLYSEKKLHSLPCTREDNPSPGVFIQRMKSMADQNQGNAVNKPTTGNAPNQGKPQNAQQAGQKPQGQPQNAQGKQQFQQPKPGAPGQKPVVIQKEENPNFRGIVRIVGKDLDGHFSLYKALLRVRGIGANLARAMEKVIVRELKLPKVVRVGDLSEEQMAKIDDILKNPQNHGLKVFMMNRQKDRENGKNLHLLMNDLAFAQKQDIQREKDIKTYKGWRFTIGQRVRGQHSRTTGRSGFTVGNQGAKGCSRNISARQGQGRGEKEINNK